MESAACNSKTPSNSVYIVVPSARLSSLLRKWLTDVNIVVLHEDWFFNNHVSELEDDDYASQVEIMFGDIRVLNIYRHKLTNLKWFHSTMNGVDLLMRNLSEKELSTPPQYILTRNLGTANAPEMTEYIMGQIIARERLLYQCQESQKQKRWSQLECSRDRDFTSLTIGLLGVGAIGKEVARVCKAFGMHVWGLKRTPKLQVSCPYVDVYRTQDQLDDLLRNSDYICNLLPSTRKTRGLLCGDVLSVCKDKKPVFINVGRGDIITEDSLINALRNGWLRGAILDVFEKEPLDPSSPLWDLPGVTITPHISGWSDTDQFFEKVVGCFVDNYHRYINGQPLSGVVNWLEGY